MDKERKTDRLLIAAALLLSLIGIVAIWDSGYVSTEQNGMALKQLIFLVGSVGVAHLAAKVRPQTFKNSAWILWIFTICLLILVEIPGMGPEINGAKRWIGIGSVTIQPSEFMKVATILLMAKVLSDLSQQKTPAKKRKMSIVAIIASVTVLGAVFLVEQQPDMATAMVAVASTLVIAMLAGVRTSIMTAVTAAICLVAVGMVFSKDYRRERFTNHLHRWDRQVASDEGYQTTQSELALAEGGLIGTGAGQGRGKHTVPAATTDFIMTTVSEEFGFIGSTLVMGLIAFVAYRIGRLAFTLRNQFDALVMAGFATWITVQATVSMMMVNGAVMPIGVPMPFISYGGSSLVSIWLAVGISISVLNRVEAPRRIEQQPASRRFAQHRTSSHREKASVR